MHYKEIIAELKKAYPRHAFVEVNGDDPYRILVSCILSLRTQDTVSLPASQRLFARAATPQTMLKLSKRDVEKLIYPVGFYHNKAGQILELSRRLLNEFNGKVPGTEADLLSFRGVGRKTANLVLSLGFNIPAICVDTHVHRISNRLGWVKSNTPEQTEQQLNQSLPRRYWIDINKLMVNHGQTLCRPQRPKCDLCPIRNFCNFGLTV